MYSSACVCVCGFVQTSTEDVGETISKDPISHWQSQLTINIVSERVLFDRHNIPGELHQFLL